MGEPDREKGREKDIEKERKEREWGSRIEKRGERRT